MPRLHLAISLPMIAMLGACNSPTTQPQANAQTEPMTPAGERPMDEVPRQSVLANGDRQYSYRNGCAVVLEAKRAVVKSEGANCQSHHRDISLLYASGD
jgi:hypothetical protein